MAVNETKEQRAEYNRRHAANRQRRYAWFRAFVAATGKDIDYVTSLDPTEVGLSARSLL